MIGFFDSGVGGLTVLKDVHKLLPDYSTMYLGDSARAPYGDKTHDQLTEFAWQGVKYLFDHGCPLVIVACNSASAQALRTIQQTKMQEYPKHRVLGVIRPTVEELGKRYNIVGILATQATVGSESYMREFKNVNQKIKVAQHACPKWGPLVEEGLAHTESTNKIVDEDLKVLLQDEPNVEAILLACTHYPVLYDYIRSILPKHIDLYEQGPLVATSLADYLGRHPEVEECLEKGGERKYFTTGDPEKAVRAAQQIAGLNPDFIQVELSKENS